MLIIVIETRDDLPDDIDILGSDAFVELSPGPPQAVQTGGEPKARVFLEKLKVTDLEVDERSGSEMLISTCRSGDVEAAEFWLNKCRRMNLQVSAEAYQALIDLAGRSSDFNTCERLAKEALNAAVTLGRSSYSALVIAACRDKNFAAAQRYWKQAFQEQKTPNGAALHQVVMLAMDQGDDKLAEECFAEATTKGTKAEPNTYRIDEPRL
eukprot:s681_g19.t1